MTKIRIGIIGFAQMHITTMAETFLALPDRFEFIGCADTPCTLKPTSTQPGTRLGTKAAVEKLCFPIPLYANYQDLLNARPDLVIVTCENSLHGMVVTQALEMGIHVILEKPMATSIQDALQMQEAARRKGRLLMVNWPTTWMPAFRRAQELAAAGTVGNIVRFTYSNAESIGPFSYGQSITDAEKLEECWYQRNLGGGSPIDYIGYGCILSRWFLGQRAVSATAIARNLMADFADIEDHATVILNYPSAHAVLDATWSTFSAGGIPSGPVVYGEKGTIVTDKKSGITRVYTERFAQKPEVVFENDQLPAGRDSLALEFLHGLEQGDVHPTLSVDLNMDAMAAMDAALRSIHSGKTENIA